MRISLCSVLLASLVFAPACSEPADKDERDPAEKKQLSVVDFGAHPDDPESGCRGLIALLHKDGHEVIAASGTCFRGDRKIGREPEAGRGTALAVGAQQPPPELVRRIGWPPDVYSPDVDYWVWEAARDVIRNRPAVGLIFVHTTDYPMHRYPPEAGESRAPLQRIDDYLKAVSQADPDLAFFHPSDHGMNATQGDLAKPEAQVAAAGERN
jgi:predicted AlkP superfamily pyrophosphatase or phosphodiesterase